MGRQENPLDPEKGPVQRFAVQLRELRRQAGGPTYRAMARMTSYSSTTLADAAGGERLPSLPVALAYVQACGGDREEWEKRWRETEARLRELPVRDAAAQPPYCGLRRFQTEDHERFFGRGSLTEALLALVTGKRLTALVGASGSGKSSLLRAGLVPALRTGRAPAGSLAALRILTPGEHPARHRVLFTAPDTAAGETVVIVDQFEEVFTLCRDPRERTEFIELLLSACDPAARLRVVIAVRADFFGHLAAHCALADALRDATALVGAMTPAELREAIVKPAAAAGLIVERALTARLIEEVGDEVGGLPLLSHVLLETWRRRQGRALTLAAYEAAGGLHGAVAQSAEALFARLPGEQAKAARRILLRLIMPGDGTADTRRPADRGELQAGTPGPAAEALEELARARLVTLDEGTVHLAHEALITAWPRLRDWVERDRHRLRVHRQLTESARTWERLGRDAGALYRGVRLAEAEEAFATASAELTEAERAFLTAGRTAAHKERRRLRQGIAALSVALCVALLAGALAFQQRSTAQEQRTLATYRSLLAQAENLSAIQPRTALRLAVAAHALRPGTESRAAVFDMLARTPYPQNVSPGLRDMEQTAAVSPDGRVLATSDLRRPGVTLWDMGNGTDRSKRTPVLADCSDDMDSLAFSHDNRTLAAVCDGRIQLWDLTDASRVRYLADLHTGNMGTLNAVVFSPDDSLLAMRTGGGTGGRLALWDVRDRAHPVPLGTSADPNRTDALFFAPDDHVLIAASRERTAGQRPSAVLWNVSDPHRPRRLGTLRSSYCLAFIPGSRLLAVCDGAGVRIWDLSRPGRPVRGAAWATGHQAVIETLAVSPDGGTLAAADTDDTIVLWNLRDPAHPQRTATLTGHRATVRALAFTDGGETLTSMDHRTVIRWQTAGQDAPRKITTLGEPRRGVTAAAFSADGILATGDSDDAVALWNLHDPAHPQRTATLTGLTDTVTGVAISSDGRTLAGADDAGGLLLWDITDPSRPRRKAALSAPGSARSLVFAGHGATLAAAGGTDPRGMWTGRWDVSDPSRPQQLSGPTDAGGYLGGFSADGQYLALLSGWNGTGAGPLSASLWKTATSDRFVALPDGSGVSAFSPDGKTLVTGAWSRSATALVWDVTDPARPRQIGSAPAGAGRDDIGNSITRLAFHPGGNLLAAISKDRTVTLWDVGERTQPHEVGTLADRAVAVAFSTDGQRLIVMDGEGPATLYDLSDLPAISADPVGKACEVAGGGPTRDEWRRYAPGQPYQSSC
ncbi:nSTAND1 domain-containing NTPase [Streptomyces sp. enrichment culture]|uniref:nSTAND1 domain-containing NTPase n=1 Tax=Streptomyces sp. enrichment culture TaxID=1795815 RepID=UPI003F56ED77